MKNSMEQVLKSTSGPAADTVVKATTVVSSKVNWIQYTLIQLEEFHSEPMCFHIEKIVFNETGNLHTIVGKIIDPPS